MRILFAEDSRVMPDDPAHRLCRAGFTRDANGDGEDVFFRIREAVRQLVAPAICCRRGPGQVLEAPP